MILTVPFARARIGLFRDDNVGVVTLANPSDGATLALPPQRLSWRTAQPPVRSVLEIRDLESGGAGRAAEATQGRRPATSWTGLGSLIDTTIWRGGTPAAAAQPSCR